MDRDSNDRNGGRDRFYRKYRGATIAAVVTAIVSFAAIVADAQYGNVASRIGNGVGALVLFGAAAFLVGWLLTRLSQRLRRPRWGSG